VNRPVPPVNRTGFVLFGNRPVHDLINPGVDALAADAAEALAEAFEEFLFPDTVDADAPQA
jgi:hypothetical protein